MTTASGQYARNFAVEANESPFVDANFTDVSGTAQISGGLLIPLSGDWIGRHVGTYTGSTVGAAIEAHASGGSGDGVRVGALDATGRGYMAYITGTSVYVSYYVGGAVSSVVATATLSSFTPDDLFVFTVTKGSPNSFALTQNGSAVTLSATTHTDASIATLAATLGWVNGNVGACTIKSFAVTQGLSAGVTATPSAASMTMTGSTPSVSTGGSATVAPAAAALNMTGATPTVSAQAYTWYALPAPGSYDSNSILAGQTYPTGSWIRVVTNFAHITYDYAAAVAAGHLQYDINDHATADSGYTGSDSATYEIKTPAGATSQYTVSATIQTAGVSAGPAAASMTMTGGSPTVTAGGSQTVTPAAAAMTMTGSAPNVTGATNSVQPGAAAMSMTGTTPDIFNLAPGGMTFSRRLARRVTRSHARSINR